MCDNWRKLPPSFAEPWSRAVGQGVGEQASFKTLFSLCLLLSGFSVNRKGNIFLDSLATHLIRGGNEKSLQQHNAFVL